MKVKRIVKLVIQEKFSRDFQILYELNKEKIEKQTGCLSVSLWKDRCNPETFFTLSDWTDEPSLENYRNSEFFRELWPLVKEMLCEKAQAWTLSVQSMNSNG